MKNKTIKIFPLIVFFLVAFIIPSNKTRAACWNNSDCPTCRGCIFFNCIKAKSDTRCSTMCENGTCAKQCTGTCKQSCDPNLGELPGDPMVNGECFENGAVSTTLSCCISGGATQTCTGQCQTSCWQGQQEQDANGTCFNSSEICCVPVDVQLDSVDLTEDLNNIQNDIQNSLNDLDLDQGNEITPLESGSNPTKNVLFTGISCIDSGNCSVNDMLFVGINLTRFLLGIIGSVALFFFMFAGFKMLTSRGNEKDITSAKQMMAQTVIGIVVFLSAYLIINFIQTSLLKTPINLSSPDEKYQVTDMCSIKHPGWTCKNYCGGNNYDYCKQFIEVGASSTPKCEYNLCGANNTKVCCE